jgi:hypothetical protein
VSSFVAWNLNTMTFDANTNAQTLVTAHDKLPTWRGNWSIITITYMGGNVWLLYGDLADA